MDSLPMAPRRTDLRGSELWSTLWSNFFFKMFGTTGFMAIFFTFYIYLLKHPAFPVTTMPLTWLDRAVAFQPVALPFYLSLWAYVSLPPVLMRTRREIAWFGLWMAILCTVGLAIFYFWPSAVPPANIDWSVYPGMAFLKGVDAAGNACPSLHVATAVYAAFWLHWRLVALRLATVLRWTSATWCVAIVYSTLATRQHVAVDVLGGVLLALPFAWGSAPARRLRLAAAGPGRP